VLAEADLLLGSALQLFGDLHTALRAGRSPARALFEARRSYLAVPRGRRERAQALLVHLSGLGDVPLTTVEPATPLAAWAFGIAGSLVVLVGLGRRRATSRA